MTERMNDEKRTYCVVSDLREQGSEFFLNSKTEPTVYVPTDPFQQDWAADSQRIADLIQLSFQEAEQRLPTRSELTLALARLREECRNGGRRLSQTEESERDADPILQTLHELTSSKGGFHGRTSHLLQVLEEIQLARHNHFGSAITPFVHVFSRRLRRLVPTLRGYGIDVSIDHHEDGSYCTIRKLPTFQMEVPDASKLHASASNGREGTDLPSPDGTDGNIRISPLKPGQGETGQGNGEGEQE